MQASEREPKQSLVDFWGEGGKDGSVRWLTLRKIQDFAKAGLMRLSIAQQAAESPVCCCCHLQCASCSAKQPAAQARQLGEPELHPTHIAVHVAQNMQSASDRNCSRAQGRATFWGSIMHHLFGSHLVTHHD